MVKTSHAGNWPLQDRLSRFSRKERELKLFCFCFRSGIIWFQSLQWHEHYHRWSCGGVWMDFVVTSCRTSDATHAEYHREPTTRSTSEAYETGLVINSTTSVFIMWLIKSLNHTTDVGTGYTTEFFLFCWLFCCLYCVFVFFCFCFVLFHFLPKGISFQNNCHTTQYYRFPAKLKINLIFVYFCILCFHS